MATGVPGSRAEHIEILPQTFVEDNYRRCRATILTAADFRSTLKHQD